MPPPVTIRFASLLLPAHPYPHTTYILARSPSPPPPHFSSFSSFFLKFPVLLIDIQRPQVTFFGSNHHQNYSNTAVVPSTNIWLATRRKIKVSHTNPSNMFSTSSSSWKLALVTVLSTLQLATAHFQIQYPSWRGNTLKDDMQWNYPCTLSSPFSFFDPHN